jgi:hypothetical protein
MANEKKDDSRAAMDAGFAPDIDSLARWAQEEAEGTEFQYSAFVQIPEHRKFEAVGRFLGLSAVIVLGFPDPVTKMRKPTRLPIAAFRVAVTNPETGEVANVDIRLIVNGSFMSAAQNLQIGQKVRIARAAETVRTRSQFNTYPWSVGKSDDVDRTITASPGFYDYADYQAALAMCSEPQSLAETPIPPALPEATDVPTRKLEGAAPTAALPAAS